MSFINRLHLSAEASQQLTEQIKSIVNTGFVEGIQSALNSIDTSKLKVQLDAGNEAMQRSATAAAVAKEGKEQLGQQYSAVNLMSNQIGAESEQSKAFLDELTKKQKEMMDERDKEQDSAAQESKRANALTNIGLSALNKAAEGTQAIFKGGFELVEGIYERMKAASPLLQAVESLFQLAMQLFFMPLGNKLGEVLIPAVIQLLDNVMAIWDSFEGKSLGEMFASGIALLIGHLSDFFLSIGDTLVEQGGSLAHIGNLLNTIGNFLNTNGEKVISGILNFSTVVVENFKTMISLVFSFYTAYLALQIASAFDMFGSGVSKGAAAAGILTAGAVGGAVTYGGLSAMGFSEGGRIPPTPEGTLIRAAEAGEAEWIVPESKMGSMGGGNTYNISVNAYSTEEVERVVNGIVSEQISESRLRGGF